MSEMKKIKIEKLTLNVGTGKDQALLEKAMRLLKNITGIEPVKTVTTKRIPSWGVRPGLPIGTKITLRNNEQIVELLTRFIKAKEGRLAKSCFDTHGNVAFGIHEYIDIPGLDYDPKIGIIGFQICVTLERPGYALKRKKIGAKSIGQKHQITQDEAIDFFKNEFKIEVEE